MGGRVLHRSPGVVVITNGYGHPVTHRVAPRTNGYGHPIMPSATQVADLQRKARSPR